MERRLLLIGAVVLSICARASADCLAASYMEYQDRHVLGGVRDNTATTVPQCQAVCDALLTCVGVDFTTGGECYIVRDDLTQITDDPGTNHYRKITTCTVSAITCDFDYRGQFTAAAGSAVGSTGLSSCLDACVSDNTCLAVAFRETSACILIRDQAALDARTADVNYRMYGKTGTCRASSCGDFVTYVDKNGPGGVPQPAVTTLQACQDACVGNPNCYGVDFGLNGCYVSQNSDILNNLGDLPGNTFYAINRDCGCLGFTPYVNMNVQGGIGKPTASDLASCQDLCVADPACTGVDFGTGGCFTNTNPDVINNLMPLDGNTFYAINRDCGVTSPSPTASAGTTPACPRTIEYPNKNGPGGLRRTDLVTESACRAACYAAMTCVGFDFGASGCWLNDIAGIVNNLADTTNNIFYEVDRICAACPTFVAYPDQNGPGGMAKPTLGTLALCQQDCVATPTCYGLDFGPGGCWHNTNANIVDNLGTQPGNTFYAIDRVCTTGSPTATGTTPAACPTFEAFPEQNGPGGMAKPTLGTLALCQQDCVATPTCYGLDFGPGGCWHNMNANIVDNLGTQAGNTFYAIDRVCTTGSPTVTGTTPACPTFVAYPNQNGPGGMAKPTLGTLTLCQQDCVATPTCYGLDFGPGGCWHNMNANIVDDLGTQAGNTFYAIDRVCTTGTPTGTGGTTQSCPSFTSFPDKNGPAGTPQTSATMEACRDLCVADDGCYGFDFGPGGCYTNGDANIENSLGDLVGNTFYLIDRVCATGCPRFVATVDRNGPGGMLQSSGTLDDCKQACIADAMCYGFDFGPGGCWTNGNANIANNLNTLVGTTFYTIDRICSGGSTVRSTVTGSGASSSPTPTVGSTTGTPGDCPTFTAFTDVHALGGSFRADATTEAACIDACIADAACIGLDYGSGGCWLNSNVGAEDNLEPLAGNTFYLIDRDCTADCPTFESFVGRNGPGGLVQPTGTTLELCEDLCVADPLCYGFDFGPGGCYTNRNANIENSLGNLAGNTFYLINRVCATDCPTFESFVGRNGPGGLDQPTGTTLELCEDLCVADPLCYGFDFGPGGCYTNRNANIGNSLGNLAGNTFYLINRVCATDCPTFESFVGRNGPGGLVQPTGTTLELCEDLCVADPLCYGFDFGPGGCYTNRNANIGNSLGNLAGNTFYLINRVCATDCPTFESFVGRNGPGGLVQPTGTTLELCEDLCVADPLCYGFDFGPGGCYTNRNANIGNSLGNLAGNTFYLINRVCATDCPRFTPFVDQNGPGGTEQPTGTTQELCEDICVVAAACVGYDFGPGGCWTNTNANVVDNLGTQAGNTFYSIDRVCTGSTTLSGSVTPTGTTTPGGTCPQFTAYVGRNGAGGTEQPTGTTQELCEAICVAAAACVGYDFGPGGCWTNTNANVVDNLGTLAGNTFYFIDRVCVTDCPQFTEYVNQNAPGGTEQPTGTTQELCEAICVAAAACVGYDFGPGGCWTSTDADVNNLGTLAGNTFYSIDRDCAAVCPRFTEYADRNGPGGTNQPTGTTQDLCEDICVAAAACVGYDFGPGGCWTNTNANVVDNLETQAGNTFYFIDRVCTGVSTSPGGGSTTPPGATTSSTCPQFTEYVDQNGPGGTERPTGTTQELCEAICVAAAACVGYDFGPGGCWTNTDADVVNNLGTQAGNTFYSIDRDCSTDCLSVTEYVDQNGPGGTEQPTGTTQELCEAICVAAAACVGYDFGPGGCWTNTNANVVDNLGTQAGNTFYSINRDCSTDCLSVTEYVNQNGPGGTEQPTGTTQDLCEDICVAAAACVGYDFGPGGCWTNTNANVVDNLGTQAGNTFYSINRDCDADCPTFEAFVGRNGPGGLDQPTGTTLELCEDLCVADPLCYGFDFGPGGCYTNRNANIENVLGTLAGNTFYLIDRDCTTATTTPGSGSTTTGGAGDCPRFTEYVNQNAPGGTNQPTGTTQALCEASCVADVDCVGYDYGSGGCWTNRNVGVVDNLGTQTGNTFYSIDRDCDTCPRFTAYPEQNGRGGISQASGTEAACRDICVADPLCVGYDYGTAGCWTNRNAGVLDNLGSLPGNTFYSIDRVCDECPRFVVYENQNGPGGQIRQSITTLDGCESACVELATCYGFDFGLDGCYLNENANVVSNLGNLPGNTFYAIDRVCDDCPRFVFYENQNGPGGQIRQSITTLDGCESACIELVTCYGFDFGLDGCYLNENANVVSNLGNLPGNTFHAIDRVCDECPRFTLYEDRNGPGGIRRPAAADEDACEAMCVADLECFGFDFGVDGCWINRNPNIVTNLEVLVGNTFHAIDRICGSTGGSTVTGSMTTVRGGTGGTTRGSTSGPGPSDMVTCGKPLFISTPQQTINSASVVAEQADLLTCLEICAADSTCVSIVLRNGNQCSTVRNGLESSVFDANAELWRYQKSCRNSNRVCSFDYQGGYYVTNAVVSRQATLGNCVAACMADVNCDAFSYNDATDDCRVVTSATELNTRFSLAGYVMYRSLSCDVVSQQTTAVPAGTCGDPYFQRYDNEHVVGGSLDGTATTQEACENRCLQNIDCIGYDFDTFDQCWLITNGLTEREADPESDHYRAQRDCSTGNGDQTCKFDYQGRYDATAVEQSSSSLSRCLQTCADNSACLAVSYGGQRCRLILNDSSLVSRTFNNSFTMYRRLSCVTN